MWDGYDSGYQRLPVPGAWEKCETCDECLCTDDYEGWYLIDGKQVCKACAKKKIFIVDRFPIGETKSEFC